ncbi:MAG: hypothetical protein P9L99_08095 [Candidatus Lernaella stagnicola]|nr:hypothetical protein [Candidatus Lernaella stagnicola]
MPDHENPELNDRPSERRTGLLWIFLAVIIVIVAAMVINKYREGKEEQRQVALAQKTEVVVWLLENQKVFGFDENATYTWSRVFMPELRKKYERVEFTLRDSGLPSLNSSEGLDLAGKYLKIVQEQAGRDTKGFFRKPKPDFGIVNYGFDNLWNLHSATIFSTTEFGPEYPKTRKILDLVGGGSVETIQNIARRRYFDYFDENASSWTIFFENFSDPLLQAWVKNDLESLVKLMQENDIEPILVTYCFDTWPLLNDIIRVVAKVTGTTLIDLEHPKSFYQEKGYLASYADDELVFLNDDGYKALGIQVTEKFMENYDQDYMTQLAKKKKK